jgi:hypothetical protein
MTTNLEHPEWQKENSLTTPEERDLENRWRPEQGAPALSENEVNLAMSELNNTAYTERFPRVDRTYADPPPPMQTIGLISFTPAKGATPNENGVFGFAKLRGNYNTAQEADQRAEFLIRNVDSYHQIYHTYVGRPFPITASSKYSAETSEIDIRKEATQAISKNIKDKKVEEQKDVDDIKKREEALLEETKNIEENGLDPFDEYITLRVKKAQLLWTYQEHIKKLEEVRSIILKTRDSISEMDEKYDDFKDKYFDKYKKAREDAGIKDTKEELETNFMSFLVQETELPGLDTEYHLSAIYNKESTQEGGEEDTPKLD